MPYRTDFNGEARKALRSLPSYYRPRIKRAIQSLENDPRPRVAEPLREIPNGYKIRVDRWRIIYQVDEEEQRVKIARICLKTGPETYEGLDWDF